MSQSVVHRLNGKIAEPPIKDGELEIELVRDTDNIGAQPLLTFSALDFDFQETQVINAHIDAGANGNGVGINEGIRYTQSLKDESGELLILDAYLQLNAAGVIYSCDFIENVPIELRGKFVSVSKRAKLINFSDLLAAGKFSTSEYVQIPYIISTRPDFKSAAIITVTGFLILYQIHTMVQDLLKIIADITGVLTGIAGILKTVVVVIGIIVTVATIIIFLFKIVDQIIQPVKYHAAMRWKRLLEIGFKELGLDMESDIFEDEFIKDTVWLPAKKQILEDPRFLDKFGFDIPEETRTTGYFGGSFFDFLIITQETFYASFVFTSDDRVIIQTKGTETKSPAFRMNPKIKMDKWETNASEIIAVREIEMMTDSLDSNTLMDYTGTRVITITRPLIINDRKSLNIDGEQKTSLPFSRASTKLTLTNPEKRLSLFVKQFAPAINGLITTANSVINARNSIVKSISKIVKKLGQIGIKIKFKPKIVPQLNLVNPNLFENRIGMMLLENDFFQVDKVLSLDISNTARNTKIKSNNSERWNADYIRRTYRGAESFVPSVRFPFGNQKREFKSLNVGVCKDDLVLLIDNNHIFAPDGSESELIAFRHKVRIGEAAITYRVPYIFTKNLQETIIIPTGQ